MSDEFSTVKVYVRDVRTLIQDKRQPYRYDDDSLVRALNFALLEGRRLRPDLFFRREGLKVPKFEDVSDQPVNIEEQFRLAFVYGTASHVLLRDEEDVQDARANAFSGKFKYILTGEKMPPAPIQGGTPGPGSAQK